MSSWFENEVVILMRLSRIVFFEIIFVEVF